MHAFPGSERRVDQPAVLEAWWPGIRSVAAAPLAGRGLSGSPVLVVRRSVDAPRFVLKAFPCGTSPDRARWVHRLMRLLGDGGIAEVPEVVAARDGGTVVTDESGLHWELVRFVEGTPADQPTHSQAAAAMTTLARLHGVASRLPGTPPRGPSAGVLRRVAQAGDLLALSWRDRLARAGGDADDGLRTIVERWVRAIDLFDAGRGSRALAAVVAFDPPPLPVQPVLRDVWSDHVLYAPASPDRVSGIVDYHAAGIDTPVTDVSRLLGSWRPPPGTAHTPLERRWAGALAAYESIRPLEPAQRRLLPFLHATAVVFGLDNWFRWTVEERRRFPDGRAVVDRIDRLSAELPAALQWLADSLPNPV